MLSANFRQLVFYTFVVLTLLLLSLENCNVCGISVEQDLSLTQSEKHALDQFRKKVTPLLYRDFMKYDIYLIRWLRGKQ